MGDRKFSWYTIVHPDYEGWPAPPIYRLVGPAIEQSGETTCDIYYRPNRKGGHTHNCCRNCLKREYRARGRGDIFDLLFSPENIREASEEEWDDDAVAHFKRMLGGEEPWLKPAL